MARAPQRTNNNNPAPPSFPLKPPNLLRAAELMKQRVDDVLSSISSDVGVSSSLILSPSNKKRYVCLSAPILEQYESMSFFSGVLFLILNCTSAPSPSRTLMLSCSAEASGLVSSVVAPGFWSSADIGVGREGCVGTGWGLRVVLRRHAGVREVWCWRGA
eukprot:CAMPEP_0174896852 /NCGR_PEP_ID=MMETSP0167-20121228/10954_1 /TAXON_ID=38298 /ORGANISM="Rhodella maculata, Strain CCMP736" /LENGTH=159 /DNA_ID=CAMNT_0016136523 /DNA_START=176 /DNA_END=656 /DNA_ORIENTATION=+